MSLDVFLCSGEAECSGYVGVISSLRHYFRLRQEHHDRAVLQTRGNDTGSLEDRLVCGV